MQGAWKGPTGVQAPFETSIWNGPRLSRLGRLYEMELTRVTFTSQGRAPQLLTLRHVLAGLWVVRAPIRGHLSGEPDFIIGTLQATESVPVELAGQEKGLRD